MVKGTWKYLDRRNRLVLVLNIRPRVLVRRGWTFLNGRVASLLAASQQGSSFSVPSSTWNRPEPWDGTQARAHSGSYEQGQHGYTEALQRDKNRSEWLRRVSSTVRRSNETGLGYKVDGRVSSKRKPGRGVPLKVLKHKPEPGEDRAKSITLGYKSVLRRCRSMSWVGLTVRLSKKSAFSGKPT